MARSSSRRCRSRCAPAKGWRLTAHGSWACRSGSGAPAGARRAGRPDAHPIHRPRAAPCRCPGHRVRQLGVSSRGGAGWPIRSERRANLAQALDGLEVERVAEDPHDLRDPDLGIVRGCRSATVAGGPQSVSPRRAAVAADLAHEPMPHGRSRRRPPARPRGHRGSTTSMVTVRAICRSSRPTAAQWARRIVSRSAIRAGSP